MLAPIRHGLILCPPEREDGQMDGLQDETKQIGEGAAQQAQGASAQVSGVEGTVAGGGAAPQCRGRHRQGARGLRGSTQGAQRAHR